MSRPATRRDTLARIIASAPVRTIDDVIAVMRALDAALPDDDGLKWFNRLYLWVTERVTTILEAVEAQVRQEFATGIIGGDAMRFRFERERSYRKRNHDSFGTL